MSNPTPSSIRLPSTSGQASTWHVAILANLKDEFEREDDDPPDAGAEFDRRETIDSITRALELHGHTTSFYSGDDSLPENLRRQKPDICFNISEGLYGDGREAQVPALCELLQIPYTASRVVANAISLEKTLTKRIWRDAGLPTPDFLECNTVEDAKNIKIPFPLFCKPSREGTGMGIDGGAIIHTHEELVERVDYVLTTYNQPALVERFLPGREFTVGYIGNPGNPSSRFRPDLYDQDGYHWFPVLELDTKPTETPGVYGYEAKNLEIDEAGAPRYLCPANISEELRQKLYTLTKRAAQAIGAADVSRADFRLAADGSPFLLEINTLPGLNPSVSDLCIMASAEGMPYEVLISEILYLAAERYRMQFHPESSSQNSTKQK